MADPGFPRGRGANSRGGGWGAPTYNFAKFSQKLHEIERIWTPGAHPSHPLRSATEFKHNDLTAYVWEGNVFTDISLFTGGGPHNLSTMILLPMFGKVMFSQISVCSQGPHVTTITHDISDLTVHPPSQYQTWDPLSPSSLDIRPGNPRPAPSRC